MLLTLDAIPSVLDICNRKLKINKKNVLFGAAIQTTQSVGLLSLQEALTKSFAQSNAALVMIGAICSAVSLDK